MPKSSYLQFLDSNSFLKPKQYLPAVSHQHELVIREILMRGSLAYNGKWHNCPFFYKWSTFCCSTHLVKTGSDPTDYFLLLPVYIYFHWLDCWHLQLFTFLARLSSASRNHLLAIFGVNHSDLDNVTCGIQLGCMLYWTINKIELVYFSIKDLNQLANWSKNKIGIQWHSCLMNS